MHRTITITVPPAVTDGVVRELQGVQGVVGLSVHRDCSVKPPGDVVVVHSLNAAADEVLRQARAASGDAALTVVTAEVASLTDRSVQGDIDRDRDEAVWEEMEAGLRHHGHVTPNFLALMGLGGAVAMSGLVSDPVPQAMALVAASVIAPGFEPIAKVPIGLVLGRFGLVSRGVAAALVGYVVLAAAAALTFRGLLEVGAVTAEQFVGSPEVVRMAGMDVPGLVVSGCGALAGMIMIAAYRRNVIAGPLIALVLIPGAAMAGGALGLGRWDLATEGLRRAALDVLMMVGAGVVVFAVKQMAVHRRQSLRRT